MRNCIAFLCINRCLHVVSEFFTSSLSFYSSDATRKYERKSRIYELGGDFFEFQCGDIERKTISAVPVQNEYRCKYDEIKLHRYRDNKLTTTLTLAGLISIDHHVTAEIISKRNHSKYVNRIRRSISGSSASICHTISSKKTNRTRFRAHSIATSRRKVSSYLHSTYVVLKYVLVNFDYFEIFLSQFWLRRRCVSG